MDRPIFGAAGATPARPAPLEGHVDPHGGGEAGEAGAVEDAAVACASDPDERASQNGQAVFFAEHGPIWQGRGTEEGKKGGSGGVGPSRPPPATADRDRATQGPAFWRKHVSAQVAPALHVHGYPRGGITCA